MSEYSNNIKHWIENRKRKGEVRKVRFYISTRSCYEPYYQNPLYDEIKAIFEGIGVKTKTVDNIPGAFNLNRNYLETDKFDAIIEYCGVYPIEMDTEKSAWLSKLDDKGEIRITVVVYDENGNEHMNL